MILYRRPAQGFVRVDDVGVPDCLEHWDVGDRVGVRVAFGQVVAAFGGEGTQSVCLVRSVGVILDLTGVMAVLDHHSRRDHMIGADHFANRPHHFFARGRNDDDIASGGFVLCDEFDCLVIDQRINDLVQRLVDDVTDLLHVPSGAHCGEVVPHSVHLVFVGASEGEHKLGVSASQDRSPIDQAALVKGLSEGECARLGDDGLVEIEECRCCAHLPRIASRPADGRSGKQTRVGSRRARPAWLSTDWLNTGLRVAESTIVADMDSRMVIGVLSGCGGAGASVLAACIAGCAALSGGSPVFLLDCDAMGGGIDVLLGCEQVAGPRWRQVRLRGSDLDASVLIECLPTWYDVSFLAADTAADLDRNAVAQVIDAAASAGPVVLDLPRWPSPLRSVALSRCDRVVLVTPAEVRAVTASAVVAAGLDPNISFVAVRGSSRSLPAARIGELLDLPVIGELPYDPASLRSAGLDVRRLRRGTRRVADAVLQRSSAPMIAA
jgi:secretion/DNA translocation related CpaE-like protein